MKNYTKYLPIVIALCALADTQFEMLKSIGLNEVLINWIKLLGLLLSVFLPSIQEAFPNLQKRNTSPVNPKVPPTKAPR